MGCESLLLLQAVSFSTAQRSQFLQAVDSNGLPQHTQFPYALASFSRSASIAVTSHSVKLIEYQNCYQFRTSCWTYVPGGASYPSGHSLPFLCSASLSALAQVHVLSLALLRPVSSILLSFAGDGSPSVGLQALRSHLLLKFYKRPLRCRSPRSWKFYGFFAWRDEKSPELCRTGA